MKREVGMGDSPSELVIVRDRTKTYVEDSSESPTENQQVSRFGRNHTVNPWTASSVYSVLIKLSK